MSYSVFYRTAKTVSLLFFDIFNTKQKQIMINSEFVKVHSVMDTIVYVALIIAGALLILLLPPDTDEQDILRLDVYFAESDDKAYLQLLRYVPYDYEPASMIYEVNKNLVQKLLA